MWWNKKQSTQVNNVRQAWRAASGPLPEGCELVWRTKQTLHSHRSTEKCPVESRGHWTTYFQASPEKGSWQQDKRLLTEINITAWTTNNSGCSKWPIGGVCVPFSIRSLSWNGMVVFCSIYYVWQWKIKMNQKVRQKVVISILGEISYCNFWDNKHKFYHVDKHQVSIQ